MNRTFSTFSRICSGAMVVGAALGWAWAAGGAVLNAQFARTNLLQFAGSDGKVAPVQSVGDWQQRRAAIIEAMETVMGPLPGEAKRCPLEIRIQDEVDCGSYVRRCLSYAAEPGSRVPAYLLIPKQALIGIETCPAVLCLHQTHPQGQEVVVGLGNNPDDEYGVELVRRGYVCLVPAYPLLVNYYPDLAQLGYQSGTMKAIWDNIRGLDLLESLPFTKKGAFGAIGHSLGGHNGIYTAVFDQRLQIVVSSCGLDAFRDYMGGDIRGWTSERYMPRLLQYPELLFDFDEIVGALAPRACFLSAPRGDTNFKWWSVDQVIRAASPIYELYGVPENLRVAHPDCGHRFPPEMRQIAYRLLDEQLQR